MGRWWSSSASDRRIARNAFAAALLLALSGCGRDRGPTAADVVPAAADDGVPSGTLPAPAAAPGSSVTGMPTQAPPPAPADATATTPADAPMPVAEDVAATPPSDVAPISEPAPDGAPTPAPATPAASAPGAPPPADLAGAGAVVTQYMAAVSSGAFAKAQGLWSTTPNDSAVLQVARGTGLTVSIGAATVDAGGRVVVPVDVRGPGDDGGERHLQVGYALQRTPGGAWRIVTASVRDASP